LLAHLISLQRHRRLKTSFQIFTIKLFLQTQKGQPSAAGQRTTRIWLLLGLRADLQSQACKGFLCGRIHCVQRLGRPALKCKVGEQLVTWALTFIEVQLRTVPICQIYQASNGLRHMRMRGHHLRCRCTTCRCRCTRVPRLRLRLRLQVIPVCHVRYSTFPTCQQAVS